MLYKIIKLNPKVPQKITLPISGSNDFKNLDSTFSIYISTNRLLKVNEIKPKTIKYTKLIKVSQGFT